ncbi:unnamed protein product [Cuscuta campestris]|uniref:Uncharacterized protein n=1 Tax=Cuscuta campestris TaxID=132261 RepID=A0A484K5N9_9ASTE|nr:unnamed protein product [Cuscuta campestris]
MAGWLFALAIMARDEMSKSEAASQVYAKRCPYVQARAYYAQAQAAIQAMRTKTQGKYRSPVAAPTSLPCQS